MNTKQLGNSDLFITPVGFGAWAIGGSGWEFAWGAQDDNASIAAIHRALELGVNWIDTAAVYGTGHSEEVVGRALASWRGPRPYVFTKCGLRWDGQGKVHYVLRADSIRRKCEDSLRRLQVEAIDLYQIHWPVDDTAELEEGWTAMAQLQREGKVRWIGVSNFNVEQMQLAQSIGPPQLSGTITGDRQAPRLFPGCSRCCLDFAPPGRHCCDRWRTQSGAGGRRGRCGCNSPHSIGP